MRLKEETRRRRIKIWEHNSLLGSVHMAESCMERILQSTTATDEAQHTAASILSLIDALKNQIKERRPFKD